MTKSTKPYHMAKIDVEVYDYITEHGKYNETFSDIPRRLPKIAQEVKE